MSKNWKTVVRRVALTVFVFAAGFLYSCAPGNAGDFILLSQEETESELTVIPDTEEVSASTEETEPETKPRSCFVYVCGEVVSPGVYELSEGRRVYEAVALAGGFTEAAADTWLNLAEPVTDGMKVLVPDEETAQTLTAAGGSPDSGESGSALVNINTATKEELMTLSGIGESRAADIVRVREQKGGFSSIEEIMEVPGIKEAAFAKICDDITV
ncbi:MAG: helix-hairpin-helix domain-containing protein [Clostridiales bacterium]|nr:helix-hairpin-helix domain-containing protein [Clostridiales bacterium]